MTATYVLSLLVVLLSTTAATSPAVCTDKDGKIVQDGEWYAPDFDDPCKECLCGAPEERCVSRVFMPHCPYGFTSTPGVCGVTCNDFCVDKNGKKVKEGELFIPQRMGPCTKCMCKIGEYGPCLAVSCPPMPNDPNCILYEYSKDVCCERQCIKFKDSNEENGGGEGNKDCVDRKGKDVKNGDWFSPYADPCMICECTNGKASDVCAMPMCAPPVPNPNCLKYESDPDHCCAVICVQWNNTETEGTKRDKDKLMRLLRKLID